MSYSLGENNPAILELQKEIRYSKQALYNASNNALVSSALILTDLEIRIGEAQQKISRLPATEQQFINIQRQYELSGSQFQLLLEKRAEAGILQASNLPDTKIIDSAIQKGQRPIGPNRALNYLFGLLFGLAIPSVVIIVLNRLNTKIHHNRSLRIEFCTEKKAIRLWSATDISAYKTIEENEHPYIKNLGPDVLDSSTTADLIYERLTSDKFKNRQFSGLLLSQAFISGLGNYLRSEILFYSKS